MVTISQPLHDDLIVEILRNIESRKTLSSFSLCSKRFHEFCEPYLYSHFVQLGDNCEALPFFLQTIIRNPKLGSYIKRFTANALLGYCTDIPMGMMSKGDWENIDLLVSKIQESPSGGKCEWFTAIHSIQLTNWLNFLDVGNWDALVAFIICLLPNLEEINIVNHASECPQDYLYLETVLRRAASLQSSQRPRTLPAPYSLPNLHTVQLSEHNTVHHPRMGFEFLRIFPFLSLPSVRTVKGHMISDFHYSPSEQPEAPFALRTLYTYPLPKFEFYATSLMLNHTVMRRESVPMFLSYFKQLRHFSWDFSYDFENGDQEGLHYDFFPKEFASSIEHLSSTLETLKLTQKKIIGLDPEQSDTLGSLSHFTKLKVLDVSGHMLLGQDVISSDRKLRRWAPRVKLALSTLPDSLEELILRCSRKGGCIRQFYGAEPFIQVLVKDEISCKLPSGLKELKLCFEDEDCNLYMDGKWKEWEAAFGRRGVALHKVGGRVCGVNHIVSLSVSDDHAFRDDERCGDCEAYNEMNRMKAQDALTATPDNL